MKAAKVSAVRQVEAAQLLEEKDSFKATVYGDIKRLGSSRCHLDSLQAVAHRLEPGLFP